jgi:putative ABC transport system substrate-binding protein
MIRRRELIQLLGAGAAAWPVAALTQPSERMRRIGMLMPYPVHDPEGQARATAFRTELRRLGWPADRLRIEERWATDDPEQLRAHAAELAQAEPAAILVNAPRALARLRQATRTIPIVFVGVSDPVGAGFVESLARPGGSITGFTLIEFSVIGKLLQALKEMVPSLTRVALVSNPDNPSTGLYLKSFASAVPSFGVRPIVLPVRDAADIERAIAAMASEPSSGMLVPPDVTMLIHRDSVTASALRHRLPAIYSDPALVASGGLMYYGADRIDQFRRAASYVDRILRGERPADLPVQQPTKFELVINLRTAKALGLDVPPMLLARADEVIE